MIIAREDIQERIEEAIGEKLDPSTGFPCGISGIAGTVSGKRYFIKCGAPSKAFTAEERGLREVSAAGEIKTVIPIAASDDFIVTEYLDGGGLPDDFFRKFGRQLDRLHRHTSP